MKDSLHLPIKEDVVNQYLPLVGDIVKKLGVQYELAAKIIISNLRRWIEINNIPKIYEKIILQEDIFYLLVQDLCWVESDSPYIMLQYLKDDDKAPHLLTHYVDISIVDPSDKSYVCFLFKNMEWLHTVDSAANYQLDFPKQLE